MKQKPLLLFTSFILAFALLFPSCAENAGKNAADTAQSAADTGETAAETEIDLYAAITKNDYQGYEFDVLTLSSGINATSRFTDEIYVEAQNGEVINDAVYNRNQVVLDKLNVNIMAISVNDVYSTARSAILANDDAYDLHGMYTKNNAIILGTEGLLRNWNEIPVIDMEKEWWNSKAKENLNVMGRLYLMSGAILISEIDDTLAMVYNKNLGESYNLESVYDLVFNGNWTLDTFKTQVLSISADLNGDGKYKPGEDLLGYAEDPASMTRNWVFSCGLLKGTIDDEGIFSFNIDADRIQTTLEKLSEVIKSDGVNQGLDLYVGLDYFIADQIYCYAIILRNIELLRDMDSDFGAIPYPKYDEEQEDYLNHVGLASPILTVPITNYADDELLGSVLETMAIASYQLVKPAYFEVALKDKYARDPETAQMLDIILESRTYDLGYTGDQGLVGVISPLIAAGKTTFSSSWARSEEKQTAKFQEYVDSFLDD